jgi:hypothetical protein
MNSSHRLSLVGAALRAGSAVIEKSASAAPAQQEVIQAGWPQEGEPITKVASLARVLATGLMIEEAEASLAG